MTERPASPPTEAAPARRDGLDHFLGCFLGGAVGDALGAAVEFDDLAAIRGRFGPEGIREPAEAYGRLGAITDDTQMLLFTAEGLVRAHHRWLARDICSVPGVVWNAYRRWLATQGEAPPGPERLRAAGAGRAGRAEEGDRGGASAGEEGGSDGWLVGVEGLHHRRAPGNTCLAALRGGRMGTPDRPVNDSKGCGGAMRIAPVGLVAADPFRLGCEIAALTHGHPTGWAAAGLFALLLAELVRGRSLDGAVEAALAAVEPVPAAAEAAAAVRRARDLAARSRGSPEEVERLGGGWVAEEAVAIAVYCALRAEDLAHGLRMAVNHSGDSDSTGSITGNLLGARDGMAAVPPDLLADLELADVITRVADDVVDAFFGEGVGDEYEDIDERVAGWLARYPGY